MPDHTYSVSREELERLRRQVGDLKGQPLEAKHTAPLIESMDRLHEAMSRLIVIFESANRDMAEDAARGIHDEHAKLDQLLDQNEKIARAVVQLADIVQTQRLESQRTQPAGTQATVQAQSQALQQSRSMQSDDGRQNFMAAQAVMPLAASVNALPQQPLTSAIESASQRNAMPTGLGTDGFMPALSSQQKNPEQFSAEYSIQNAPSEAPLFPPRAYQPSAPALPQLPVSSIPQAVAPARQMPQAPRPPADIRTQSLMPTQAYQSFAPQQVFPSQQQFPALQAPLPQQLVPPLQPIPPLRGQSTLQPPSIPRAQRQTPLSEQGSFVAQPISQVQPAFSADGVLSPLPPPPPPASKRTLMNRFSFS